LKNPSVQVYQSQHIMLFSSPPNVSHAPSVSTSLIRAHEKIYSAASARACNIRGEIEIKNKNINNFTVVHWHNCKIIHAQQAKMINNLKNKYFSSLTETVHCVCRYSGLRLDANCIVM